MELNLTEFIMKLILCTAKQKRIGTISEARCSSLNNLYKESI